MSYLSMRMREEGFWSKRQSSEVTITITADVSKLERALSRLAAQTLRAFDAWPSRESK